MTSIVPETFELPRGWYRPDATRAEVFHAELQRELPPGHLLYHVPVETFAHLDCTDDVLFRHHRDRERFTLVHLTRLGRTEIDEHHPAVEFDGSFTDFLAYYEELQ